jgi:hypothetical protein
MKFNNHLVIPFALLASFSSQAELLNLTFTDTNANEVTVERTKTFINPVSSIKIKLSSGLDRKVAFIIKRSDGTVVDSGESPVISVNDTLTVNGNTYYGYELTISALPDSDYVLTTQLKDYNGNIVDQETFNFVVDTVKPVITGTIDYSIRGWSTGSYEVFGVNNFRSLATTGVTDNNVDVLDASIIAKKVGDPLFLRKVAAIDSVTNGLSISAYPTTIFPEDGVYDVGFEVYDKAGNKGIKTQVFTIDNVLPDISFSDVWNPNTSAWEVYTPGMTVFENPSKFRIRRNKADHTDINNTLIGWYSPYSYTEGDYIYNDFTAQKPASYTYQYIITQNGKGWVARQSHLNYVLGPGVNESPQFTTMDWYSAETGWVIGTTLRTKDPVVVSQVKIKALARNYVQRAVISGGGECDIPVNGTECTINTNYVYETEKGYSPKPIWLKSVTNGALDGVFNVHSSYFYTYWDFNQGELLAKNLTDNTLEISYLDADRINNWQSGMWYTSGMKLIATNNNSGIVTEKPASTFYATTYNQYAASFNLSVLPEGDYKIDVIATDSYGNETLMPITNSKVIDTTPPDITITNNGILNFNEAVGLDGILITLADALPAEIVSIELRGGPTSSVVNMAWRSTGVDQFQLEYPRIFPSLVTGEEYYLKVAATDSFFNLTEQTVVFMYEPPNIEVLPSIEILSSDVQLLNRNDEPYVRIYKEDLRRDDGLLVNGLHNGFFTLRADSAFSVTVAGESVAPGQTVEISFRANYGTLDIPIYPNEKIVGKVNYLFEIVSVHVDP